MTAVRVPRTWELSYDRRPPTMNTYRTLHHHARAKVDREWRQAFAWLARAERIPKLDAIVVVAAPMVRDGRLPDVGACFPAVKAAIDGLVDARVIPDDTPAHLSAITFAAPRRSPDGVDRLVIVVDEDVEA